MMKMKGLYPALVTPFDDEGRLNIQAVQRLVSKLAERGADGFYVGGSTGEAFMLTMEERKMLLESVMDACPNGKKIIANIGMMATDQSIELAKHAEKAGASAISSVPPFYFSFNLEEYIKYYNDLANAVTIPVLIYNIPAMSGVKFDKYSLDRLLKDERVMGLKHTSYDLFQLQMLIQENPDKTFFIGHDELFLSALSVGAESGIGSTYNIMPEKFVKLMECYKAGQQKQAIALQGEINWIISALLKVGIFKGIKEILRLQGIDCGNCRRPFQPLNDEEKAVVKSVFKRGNLLRLDG